MQPTQTLPSHYRSLGTLDITKDRRALIFLNVIGLALLLVSGWAFLNAIAWLRGPQAASELIGFEVVSVPDVLGLIAGVLALTAFYVTLHEAIHGLFFWWFTGARPRFAFRWTHAYAAAPDWYLPRGQYLVTALAPLVFITLGGLALVPLLPGDWLTGMWYILTMNAGGAVGDLLVAGWLLREGPDCLAQDRGDSITLFAPQRPL